LLKLGTGIERNSGQGLDFVWFQERRIEHPRGHVGRDIGQILFLPGAVLAARKWPAEVDFDRQPLLSAGADIEPHAAVGLAVLGQDEHHRPVGAAEDTLPRFLVHGAGKGTAARMRMHPDSPEAFGLEAGIDLPVEELRHRLIVEANRRLRAILLHQLHVIHVQQVAICGNAESAHFSRPEVPQVQQLGPGRRTEPQEAARRGVRPPKLAIAAAQPLSPLLDPHSPRVAPK
jgi:hypothetical protein